MSRPGRSVAPARRCAAVVAVAGALALSAGCGQGANDSATVRTTAPTGAAVGPTLPPPDGRRLPPNDAGALRSLYDPVLAPLGLKLTRGALLDRTNDGYTPSDDGTHLALYVAPLSTAPYTPDQYARNMWTLAALVTPDVFARWPGVQSYDICQEQQTTPGSARDPEPPAVTQVELDREAAGKVDWKNGSLAELLYRSRSGAGVEFTVRPPVTDSAVYKDADAEAQRRLGSAASPATTGTIPTLIGR